MAPHSDTGWCGWIYCLWYTELGSSMTRKVPQEIWNSFISMFKQNGYSDR